MITLQSSVVKNILIVVFIISLHKYTKKMKVLEAVIGKYQLIMHSKAFELSLSIVCAYKILFLI